MPWFSTLHSTSPGPGFRRRGNNREPPRRHPFLDAPPLDWKQSSGQFLKLLTHRIVSRSPFGRRPFSYNADKGLTRHRVRQKRGRASIMWFYRTGQPGRASPNKVRFSSQESPASLLSKISHLFREKEGKLRHAHVSRHNSSVKGHRTMTRSPVAI
jgi:hypothetical protein